MIFKYGQAPIKGGFKMEGYWVWCGSVIRVENKYHMFASRWPKTISMHPGWLFSSEVVRATSDSPEGPYSFQEVVLKRRGPEYWDGMMTHNPYIMKVENEYKLFYVGTTYPTNPENNLKEQEELSASHLISCANQRIGVAISKNIDGPWLRQDTPILAMEPNSFDNGMMANPSVALNENGRSLLLYKGRGYKKLDHKSKFPFTAMKFGVAMSENNGKDFRRLTEKPIFENYDYDLEDPFIWRADSNHYCMIAKDMDGRACGEPRGGAFAHSFDGKTWKLEEGVCAYSRKVSWSNGVEKIMGNLERPFILFENNIPIYAFFAVSDGKNGMKDCKNTWNMALPIISFDSKYVKINGDDKNE